LNIRHSEDKQNNPLIGDKTQNEDKQNNPLIGHKTQNEDKQNNPPTGHKTQNEDKQNNPLSRDVAQIDIPTLLDVRTYGDRLLIVFDKGEMRRFFVVIYYSEVYTRTYC
jgi:hypothetical protein